MRGSETSIPSSVHEAKSSYDAKSSGGAVPCHRCEKALSLAAHDMKTPLAVMNGYIELMLSGELGEPSESHKSVLLQMQTCGELLGRVVEDTLSFSDLMSGMFKPRFQKGDIHKCIAELTEFWGPCLERANIRFRVEAPNKIPEFKFDWQKTQRVLSNLLENAMRYTPPGGQVWLEARSFFWDRRRTTQSRLVVEKRKTASGIPNAVLIVVGDDGPGIAPEFQKVIFDVFVRLPHRHKQVEGTGLGLAIAKSLTTALGGGIWLESEPGHGSKFLVVLPTIRES
jgi:two-component system, NtrC family, sensor histidine kinase KinB